MRVCLEIRIEFFYVCIRLLTFHQETITDFATVAVHHS